MDVLARRDKNRCLNYGKVVLAVCHCPQLLISAGIVKGLDLTPWPSIAVNLEYAEANWIDNPVVQKNNIITTRKPADLT